MVPTLLAEDTTAARKGAERAPTRPTRWGSGFPLSSVGMTMAAATTARMSRVPTRKILPQNRSRISRAATKPTSLVKGPNPP